MEESRNKDIYKTSRVLYILEAAFEYFINLLISGAYLAKVTTMLGISDAFTGIITSISVLASSFQLVAIFLTNKTPVKRWVTFFHTLNQLFFACVFLLPCFHIAKKVKIILFILFLLGGQIIAQIINAPKLNWFLSLIDKKHRGSFTSLKEVVSLLGGMIVSFVAGMVMDYYEAIGNMKGAFLFCSFSILVLALLHTGTLVFSKEKPKEEIETQKKNHRISSLLKNKSLMRIIMVSVLYRIAVSISTSFYGTYQIKELAFSMTFISIISMVNASFRAVISTPIGKKADKSFISTLKFCYTFAFLGFLSAIFMIPSNGKLFYVIYTLLSAVAAAGIDNCEMNLTYVSVPEHERTAALALRMAMSGLAGFLATLAVSPLVSYIQNNGNNFLGLSVYAQQIVSALSAIIIFGIILYLHFNKD